MSTQSAIFRDNDALAPLRVHPGVIVMVTLLMLLTSLGPVGALLELRDGPWHSFDFMILVICTVCLIAFWAFFASLFCYTLWCCRRAGRLLVNRSGIVDIENTTRRIRNWSDVESISRGKLVKVLIFHDGERISIPSLTDGINELIALAESGGRKRGHFCSVENP